MGFTPNPTFERDLAREVQMMVFLGDIAKEAAAEVARRAPVDTGRLRASVTSYVRTTGAGHEGVVKVGGKAFYWHMVEYGTSRLRARPFVRPGVQAALSRRGGRLGESR